MMLKKLLAATTALILVLALAACAKEQPETPTTAPTTAPTTEPTTQPTTEPTAPDASKETWEVHNLQGLQYRLPEDFTLEEKDNSASFHRDHIHGAVEYGTQQDILGTTVANSMEAAEYLKQKLAPGNNDTVIGSSTGVGFYLTIPTGDKTQAIAVYISGENCWKVTAESPNAIDRDYLVRLVGRCAIVPGE